MKPLTASLETAEKFGERFDQIARAGSVVIDGERSSFDATVTEDQEVALLPPVSGGALPSLTAPLLASTSIVAPNAALARQRWPS